MANSKQYLEWHGQQWRVRVKVPDKLRSIIGKSKLIHPLHTGDLQEADAKKWPVVTSFKATLNQARKILETDDPIMVDALHQRLFIKPGTYDDNYEWMIERAYEIEKTHGEVKAHEYVDIANSSVTPLSHHLDEFLKHKNYKIKTANDVKRVIGELEAWLNLSHQPLFVETLNRRLAGDFISQSLTVKRGIKKATAYKGFLSQYWKWLSARGYADIENPWVGQPMGTIKINTGLEHDGGKRPYTNDEVLKLLTGPADPLLYKLMRIAALSGMRLEEICQLRVSDCLEGTFSIRYGKTDSARRDVPIHSALTEIVRACLENKQSHHFMISGLPKIPMSRDTRSDPAAKKFTRYRRKCGVDERPNGKAKSNVDFHSFRRWFIRKARDARLQGANGFDEWTIVEVVGHSDKDRPLSLDLSQRTYAGVDSMKAKKLLVEAVKLPSCQT
jgi:integrase